MTTEVFANRAVVVVVAHGEWQQTSACLEALRSTLGPDDQVIVLQGKPSEVTKSRSSTYREAESRFDQEDQDSLLKKNYDLFRAGAEFIVLMSDESLVSDGWLDELLEPFWHSDVLAVGPSSNRASSKQSIPNIEFLTSRDEVLQFAANWRRENAGRTGDVERLDRFCIALRAHSIRHLEGFDWSHFVDDDMDEDLRTLLGGQGSRLVLAHGAYVHRINDVASDPTSMSREVGGERLEPALSDDGVSFEPLLSVCLIVKDEEEMLGACLESVADIADEVVVYDTGSTDRTIEIALASGAKVIEGYWDNDFARARNAALEHASGRWVLTLDADEIFQCDPQSLGPLLRSTGSEVEAFLVPIENLEGVGSVGMTHMSARLARRTSAVWRYSLHEQLVSVEDPTRELRRVYLSDARIVHRGYLAQVMKSKNKAERNLTISRAALNEDDANKPYATLNYGRSLVMAGRTDEAVEVLREATSYSEGGFFSRTVFTTLVTLLTDLERYDEALEAVVELRRYSTSQITADIAEGRARIAKGETELGLAILARLPLRGRDDDAFEYSTLMLTGIRAEGLVALGRFSEAADLVLESIRCEGVIKVDLGKLVRWMMAAGRQPSEIAEALNVDDLIPALGQMVDLNVDEADAVLEGVHERFPDRLEPLAIASRIGPRLPIERALIWSSRLRQQGLADACPLVAMAKDENRDPRARILAAAVAFGAFADRTVVRSVHDAMARLDPEALEQSKEQISRLAPGLMEANHVEPEVIVAEARTVASIPTKMVRAAKARVTMKSLRAQALRGGVNVVGAFSASSVDGEIARTMTRALIASGCPVSTVDYNSDGRIGPIAWTHLDAGDQPFGTSLLVIPPEDLGNYAMDHGTASFNQRYMIGVWRSEFDCPSTMMGVAAQMLREIWTPSKFAAQVLERSTDHPVFRMPIPIGAQPIGANCVSREC